MVTVDEDREAVTLKKATYLGAREKIRAVLDGEDNLIAKMATVSCLLAQAFPDRFYWAGFYCVDEERDDELIVGPYQGTLGCLRIAFGKGVCGTAAQSQQTQIVKDVHKIANHIACDSLARSEIVVPVKDQEGRLIAVLDIDSTELGAFDTTDQTCLEQLMAEVFA